MFAISRCRRCHSTDIYLSRRRSYERVLWWLTDLRPFHCLGCNHRTWGIRTEPRGTSLNEFPGPRPRLSNLVPDGAESAVVDVQDVRLRSFPHNGSLDRDGRRVAVDAGCTSIHHEW